MPNITIDAPLANSTVPRTFTATGTWADPNFPTITVVLKDSDGNIVTTGATAVGIDGTWTSSFKLSQDYTGLTLVATINGTTSDSHSGITVSQ